MRILTLIDAFLPAYKHGGPLRTVAGMVEQMPRTHQFWILTRDRDLGDQVPFPGLSRDQWIERGPARVRYMSPEAQTLASLVRIVRAVDPDVVYANSVFSALTRRFLLARRLRRLPHLPTLVAPRGELAPGALALKRYKKAPFLAVAARVGLFDDVDWQGSTQREREDIHLALRGPLRGVAAGEVHVARDLVARPRPVERSTPPKVKGAARLVFVSRIVRNKNLLYAIAALAGVRGSVSLDIHGPIEDPDYWKECLGAMERLPLSVRVRYLGALPHERVGPTFADHDFFVLPTCFENFGHVIMESLAAGCPAILSDQTAWRGLEGMRAGFDMPLSDPRLWTETIQRCVDMGPDEHERLRAGSIVAAEAFADVAGAVQQTVAMFERVVGRRKSKEDPS